MSVITTPMGRRFVDVDWLASLTGEPVRSDYRMPDEPNELPAADAVIVAPATFNTMNKYRGPRRRRPLVSIGLVSIGTSGWPRR